MFMVREALEKVKKAESNAAKAVESTMADNKKKLAVLSKTVDEDFTTKRNAHIKSLQAKREQKEKEAREQAQGIIDNSSTSAESIKRTAEQKVPQATAKLLEELLKE